MSSSVKTFLSLLGESPGKSGKGFGVSRGAN